MLIKCFWSLFTSELLHPTIFIFYSQVTLRFSSNANWLFCCFQYIIYMPRNKQNRIALEFSEKSRECATCRERETLVATTIVGRCMPRLVTSLGIPCCPRSSVQISALMQFGAQSLPSTQLPCNVILQSIPLFLRAWQYSLRLPRRQHSARGRITLGGIPTS